MLTDKQTKFLDLIFLPEYIDDYKSAALAAGYSPTTPINNIIDGVKEMILERVEMYLALSAPKSAKRVVDVLNDPEIKGAKAILEASGMILDRVGVVKKDRIEIEHKSASGIFIIPAKKELT